MHLILFLLLLYGILPRQLGASSGYGNCPYGCHCVSHPAVVTSWQVTCEWPALLDGSPFSASPAIRTLHITCYEYTVHSSVPVNFFTGLRELHQLTIEKCGLSSLPSAVFAPLSNLRALQLLHVGNSSQPLLLNDDLWPSIPRLEKLHISGCGLSALPSSLFCALPHLQVLNVSGNALTESALGGNSVACSAAQLIILDLSHNRIRELFANSFDNFPTLRTLHLSRNAISSLHSHVFNRTKFLQQVDLENNQITTIGALPQTLVYANLATNFFRSLPASVASAPSLVLLNISSNSLTSPLPTLTSSYLETLDASRNFLRAIPRLSNESAASLQHLILAHNAISKLEKDQLQDLSQLLTLDLSSNELVSAEDHSISSSPLMSSLRLGNNSLDSIPAAFLTDLALEVLDLSNNRLNKVPISLSRLAKCHTIDLSGNLISSISHFVFSAVPKLHRLDLSRNKLEKLSAHELSDCPSLSWLSLSSNYLREISLDTFNKCDSLRSLDVSSNRLASLSLSPFLHSLRRLNLTNNFLSTLDWDALPRGLEHLHADSNRIGEIKGDSEKHSMRVLSLSRNALQYISSSSLPPSVEKLNISRNSLLTIAPSTLSAKSALSMLDVSYNLLKVVPAEAVRVYDAQGPLNLHIKENPLKCSCEMDWMQAQLASAKPQVILVNVNETRCTNELDGRRAPVLNVSTEQMLCNYTKMCNARCPCCDLPLACDCRSVCPKGCVCFHDAAGKRNIVRCNALSHKDAQEFDIRDVPRYATHIYISDVSIPVLRKHELIGKDKLLHLHINGTGLRQIEPMAFNTLTQLTLLDLSNNSLEEVSADALYRTWNITHLFLNDNKLRQIDEHLTKRLAKLQLLTLHNNELEDIPASLRSPALLSLSLAGNPFRCDCPLSSRFNTPAFYEENAEMIVDAEQMMCMENVTKSFKENDTTILSAFPPKHGEDLVLISMSEFVREQNISICVSVERGWLGNDSFSELLLLLLGIVVVLLGGVACFRCCFTSFKRRRRAVEQRRYVPSSMNCSSITAGRSPLPDSLLVKDTLHYDIFLSYAKKDEKMVIEQIGRVLESEGFTVCLLHKHGPQYDSHRHAVSDDLTNLMRSAASVVVVLTRNFVENEWEKTEIAHAHKYIARHNTNNFVAIYYDDVDMNALPEELGQILRKKKCLRVTEQLLFWKLLEGSLPLPYNREEVNLSTSSGEESPYSNPIYSDSPIYSGIQPGTVVPSVQV